MVGGLKAFLAMPHKQDFFVAFLIRYDYIDDRHGDKGYFLEPTIFGDVQDDMQICQEEIFGPVQAIQRFSTLEEAIQRANK